MTILSVAQDAAQKIGVPSPSALITSNDPDAKLIKTLIGTICKELGRRHDWQELTREATFTTVATESQGTLLDIASDLDRIIPNTAWDRTQNRPLGGPLTSKEWQQLKSSNTAGPYNDMRIVGKELKLIPVPTVGNTVAFEYITSNIGEDIGATELSSFATDTDVPLLDEYLIMLYVVWQYKRTKGIDYRDDFQIAEIEFANRTAATMPRRTLNLGRSPRLTSGINAPDGSWSV
ncbi:hypothetical protein [Thalassospira lohafexi]|uniref:Uncharacterized protein n=1 Tax=Thalassospira lohafexi TaxID=744227 RepID=A0A2N3L0V0_9PROT|nr:hypothetical protein [Thalassospira lohafexi]PKR56346.1 hypothetical protein COO92_21310 [Thalassospira lohafexi]